MEKPAYNLSEDSVTVFWEGKPYTVRKDNANFQNVRQALLDARYEDVGQYLDIKKSVENFIEGDVEVKDEVVYYRGYRLAGVVVDKLLEMLRAGMKDSAPLVNFIKNLQVNPSSNSVNQLYTFLGYKSLPISPEGKVLGYKGVQDDFYSNTGNADTLVLQGSVNERHQIFNGIGETIEVARRSVDDNKDNHCSHGLHIGSFDYAESWSGSGGKLLLVEFDPQDAVSVPDDCSFQKLRVCKYTVVADISDCKQELDKAVYVFNKPIYNEPSAHDGYPDGYPDGYEDLGGTGLPDGYDDDDFISMEDLDVRNYIENKHEEGISPTLKEVQDHMVDSELTCLEVKGVAESLGFVVEQDENISMSESHIYSS